MKHIIMGNGVNINFDKNKKRWQEFIIDCQVNFLVILNKAKVSSNHKINSIWQVWEKIKKFIDFDKENSSLENLVRFFVFTYYKKYFNSDEEFKDFLKEIWGITIFPFVEKDTTWIDVPEFKSNKDILELNTHFENIKSIYKKAVEITLFNEYKINEILIPTSFISFVNNNYSKKISLNYDDNLNSIDGLIKLHGSFNELFFEYNKEIPTPKEKSLIEYVNFIKKNTLGWDMVLESLSQVKQNQLKLLKQFSGYGAKKMLDLFEIQHKNINPNNIKINNKYGDYEILSELKGEIELIGVSPNNDEKIISKLLDNKSITKITIYTSEEKTNKDKILYKHFNSFWKKLEDE